MIERGNGPAPKAGANSTGTYGGQTGPGSPFPKLRQIMNSTVAPQGRTYQSMTPDAIAPMGTSRDVATQPIFPATQSGSAIPSQARGRVNVPLQQPHEKGRFFGLRNRGLISTVGAPSTDPTKDTLRHPNPKKWTRITRKATPQAVAGERTHAASFGSSNTLTGNAANGTTMVGRWATIKRGAAG
jgi:hypothetical protein